MDRLVRRHFSPTGLKLKLKVVGTPCATTMQPLTIWADGCCNKNGSGWAVICPERRTIARGEISGATNQQAELSAVIQAVHLFGSDIVVVTDSKYTIGCFSEWWQRWLKNGWKNAQGKPVENQPLIQLGLQLGAARVSYRHVKGHSGDLYNEMADYYSKNSQMRSTERGWTLIQ